MIASLIVLILLGAIIIVASLIYGVTVEDDSEDPNS